jgi:hypothetical protein
MNCSFYIKTLFFCTLFFCSQLLTAQIFINELDADTPGIDNKEFVEIRTLSPNTSLNGYILVFFNGNPASSTANLSYYTIDLSNITTDINGIATVGCNSVSPVPDKIFPDNIIQNGEDAIAIYQAPATAFPDGTLATTTNLVHALAYDTSDPDAIAIMALLGIALPQMQMNENEHNAQQTESIQRKNDGSFEVKLPTPGAMNDSSGVLFNGISILASNANRTEGDTIHITITTQTPVTTALNFNISLSNGNFNLADYTGNVNVAIPAGSSTWSTVITTVDDTNNEGDETAKIKIGAIPTGFNKLNDNLEIIIIDNDFTIDPWGPPTQPTYGIVASTAPVGYYNSINGLSGSALKQALQNIIADSTVVRAHNYGDMIEILKEADHNPKNGNQVCLMYVETPRAKYDFQTTSTGTGKWNREHIYPQSRGGYSNGTADIPDGINVYLPTNANDLLAGHADAHHLRAEDATENSTRNNKDYGQDYNGPTGNQGSWKGDVARAVFYMCVRYNGLDVVTGNPNDTTTYQLGDLDSLLLWNNLDPRDDFEMYRNNYIYTWQMNRNPFIDLPDLASYIWGSNVGQIYHVPLFTTDHTINTLDIYPNPIHSFFYINHNAHKGSFYLYNLNGQLVQNTPFENNNPIQIAQTPGIYLGKFVIDTQTPMFKMIQIIE